MLFEGVFQNIHESFDEIDSKSLNQLYSRARPQGPASEISGETWERNSVWPPSTNSTLATLASPSLPSISGPENICNGNIEVRHRHIEQFSLMDVG